MNSESKTTGRPRSAAAPDPSPVSRTLGPRLAAVLLFVLATALYLPTLGNGLTNWDDPRYVAGNPFATGGVAGLLAAWTTPYDRAYYPLTHSLHWAIQAVAGTSPLAHHLVQVLLFALAVALVPAALRAFRVPRGVALGAALLWAAHPLRVESVSWAANLKDTLSGALVLASLALYGLPGKGASANGLPGRGRGYWASAVVFALALLAKSTVFPVAGVFFLLAWRDGRGVGKALRDALPFLVPAAAVAVLAAALHLGGEDRIPLGGSVLAAIPSALWLPWWYLGRTLIPRPSLAIYPFDPVGWGDPRFAAAAVLWAGLAVFVLRARVGHLRDRVLAVGAWWLPGAAVTGLVPLLFPVADRYTLLPSLAVCAGVVGMLAAAVGRWPRLVALATGAVALAAVALGVSSVNRQREWRDSTALWEADRDRDGGVAAARINLAGAYGAQGRWDEALAELDAAESRGGRRRSGLAADRFLAHLGKAKAEPGFALALDREFRANLRRPEGLLAVAERALRGGYPAAARVAAAEAIRLDDSSPAHALLARIEVVAGDFTAALGHADRALELNPAAEPAVVTRAIALANLKRWDEALAATERRLADREQQDLLTVTRAMVLSATGREEEAREVLAGVRERLGQALGSP